MVLGVRANAMAGLIDPPHHGGIRTGHVAHQKISHLDALRGEDVENRVGVARQRAIIEGQDDLFVGKR